MLSKKIKPIVILIVLLTLLMIALVLLFNTLLKEPAVQRQVLSEISRHIGYELSTGNLEFTFWNGIGISADDLKVKSQVGSLYIEVQSLKVTFNISQLFKGRLVPSNVYLLKPKVKYSLPTSEKKPDSGAQSEQVASEPVSGKNYIMRLAGLNSLSLLDIQSDIEGLPFKLKDLNFYMSQENESPLKLKMSIWGKASKSKKDIPFILRGLVTGDERDPKVPFAELYLQTSDIPASWLLPASKSITGISGNIGIQAKFKYDFDDGPILAEGKIDSKSLRFTLASTHLEKKYDLKDFSIGFDSEFKDEIFNITSLKLKGSLPGSPDFLVAGMTSLDLKDRSNPFLRLKVLTPVMPLNTFKGIFPTPLLPPWVGLKLMPDLIKGNIRVDLFSLDGTISQISRLNSVQNANVLKGQTTFNNFVVIKEGDDFPFEGVSGSLSIDNGRLLLSGVGAKFLDSRISDGIMDISSYYENEAVYKISFDGLFDLEDIPKVKNVDIIPAALRNELDRCRTMSGKMDAHLEVDYEKNWINPDIKNSWFRFSNCRIEHEKLVLPLTLDEAELKLDGDGWNSLEGAGCWGESAFEAKGTFDKTFLAGTFDITAYADIKESLSAFDFLNDKLFVKSDSKNALSLNLKKTENNWAAKGTLCLQGMTVENDQVMLTSSGNEDKVLFNLDYNPELDLTIKDFQFFLKDSVVNGFFSGQLQGDKEFSFKLTTKDYKCEDSEILLKTTNSPVNGKLTIDVTGNGNAVNPENIVLNGKLETKDLSLDSDVFQSPVTDCNMKIYFDGKNSDIQSLNVHVGESDMNITGKLKGWGGLIGNLHVKAKFFDFSDFMNETSDDQETEKKESSGDTYFDNADLTLTIEALKGRFKKIDCDSIITESYIHSGDLFIKDSHMKIHNGGDLRIKGDVRHVLKKPELDIDGNIKLINQPFQSFMHLIGIENTFMHGILKLDGNFSVKGDAKDIFKNLSGSATLDVEEGYFEVSSIIFKILNFMSLQKIFMQEPSSFAKQGFFFQGIQGQIDLSGGIMKSDSIVMTSSIFNAVGTGKVDFNSGLIDFTIGTQPLGTVDTLMSKIPVVGYVFTGPGKSILVYFVKVNGFLDNPEITHMPMQSLGSGVVGVFTRLLLTPERLYKKMMENGSVKKDPSIKKNE